MAKRIPVVLVAGFLGAGKTTLLNHLLRSAEGIKIAVVVNDFGSVNIDAMLVSAQVDSMVSLGNGCLCCVLDTSDLDGMFTRLARTRPDVIVVEASGVAEPGELVQMVLASRNQRIRYAGLLMVVDGAHFAETRDKHPEVARHLRYADLIVANKDDLLDAPSREALAAALTEAAPGVPVLATRRGRIDPSLLFDPPATGPAVPRARQLSFDDLLHHHDDHDAHLHAAYDTVHLECADPVDPRLFADFVGQRVDSLFRMKGFVHFALPGRPDRYTLQLVGRHVAYTRSGWPRGRPPATSLVAIGTRLDAGALHTALAACIRPAAHGPVADPDIAMAPIHRHLENRLREARPDPAPEPTAEPDAEWADLPDR
ncbi:CobW family GTP-binding protein [Yinghuangia seranimata]|uniref:CobW family GTP-binding protein n=1 Tax=Yinghuangia seranimata TaxID=408067 RepID=UPI00248C9DA8|nr:CobW family GTP-binding protein [Yinghuangia seranimata]MDI2125025.1 GTP-binding protein [Yinghuangia seranimata]